MPVARFQRGLPTAPAPAAPLSLADLKLALRIDGDEFDSALTRNLAAATELANRQAPDAPQSLKNEAVIRAVSWFHEGPGADEVSQAGIWRRCGAESLLSDWTPRRGGIIG